MKNSRFISLAVPLVMLSVATPARALPDLVVADLQLVPSSPGVGQGTLRATITNIGPDPVDLPLFEFVSVSFLRNGIQCDETTPFRSLAAGETVVTETTACNPASAGVFEITVTVDSNSDVMEANEANNSRTEQFEWGGYQDGFEDL